jgi:hypothetical protein
MITPHVPVRAGWPERDQEKRREANEEDPVEEGSLDWFSTLPPLCFYSGCGWVELSMQSRC